MRAVVQRALMSDVVVIEPGSDTVGAAGEERFGILDPDGGEMPCPGRVSGSIDGGLVVFLGVEEDDTGDDAAYMAEKICGLRVFDDEDGKMNLSVRDLSNPMILAVSQFTLLGDVRKGRRPSFTTAEKPERANELYREFVEKARALGVRVEEGEFQTHMVVRILNDGPVTILIDSRKAF
jgi:D-tyrosyl-tRNA(Tyr) deacylase